MDLDTEKESILKKKVIEYMIEKDLEVFYQDPQSFLKVEKMDQEIRLTRRFYNFIRTCPLLCKKKEYLDVLDKLIIDLPNISMHIKKGVKKNVMENIKKVLIYSFSFSMKTEYESQKHSYFEKTSEFLDWMNEEELQKGMEQLKKEKHFEDVNELEKEEDYDEQGVCEEKKDEKILENKHQKSSGKIVSSILEEIAVDLELNGGGHYLFQTIQKADTIDKLPPLYKHFFQSLHSLSSSKLPKALTNPDKLSKIRSVYDKIPKSAFVALFHYTNPFYFTSSLFRLLCFRPFGAKSLLQRILITLTDTKKTEREIDFLRNSLDPLLYEKILEADQNENKFKNIQEISEFLQIDESMCFGYLSAVEMKRRLEEKKEFIEIIESENIISFLSQLIPILQNPFMDLYSHGDISMLLRDILVVTEKFILLGEDDTLDNVKKLEIYASIIQEFQEVTYEFVHRVSMKEDSSLCQLINWMINSLQNSITVLPINSLFRQLSSDEQRVILEEINNQIQKEKEKEEEKNDKEKEATQKKHSDELEKFVEIVKKEIKNVK